MNEFKAMSYEPLEWESFSAEVTAAIGPDVKGPQKLMASMGALPSPPEETLRALYQLTFDGDSKIASGAERTLGSMPAEMLVPGIKELKQPLVLDYLARKWYTNDQASTAIARNKHTAFETMRDLASFCSRDVADVIATNQMRLLREPEIIAALAQNEATPWVVLNALLELTEREGVALDDSIKKTIEARRDAADISQKAPTKDPLADFQEEDGMEEDVFDEAVKNEAEKVLKDEEEQRQFDQMSRREKEALTEPVDEEEERKLPAFALIQTMSIAQKMKYLTACGSDALNVLVRDPNRMIHEAAIRSPKVRPVDVSRWSKDKSLPESVLAYIASRKDWVRSYDVLYALVCNPRTPLPDAMNMINHVRTNDLKQLLRNKNVSSVVARQAKLLYRKRSGR